MFIRHRAPYDGFSQTDNLQRMLHRYMQSADLSISEQTYGLHSLRSTLARTLLEHGTPLLVIADVLGHQDIQATSHYLKIDLKGLRHCAIDPDSVIADER
ncbi:MAG: tyrosine-type recombinase/integrase [Firmicutes bacterium]|nr:tyrosine-type recombinase/integrase [Bacillota bacterium]